MSEIPFIKWEPYKGYLNNHCPHWSIDGTFCCSCGDKVPNKVEQYMPENGGLRNIQAGINDTGMTFESNFTLGESDESGCGLDKKELKEWNEFVAKNTIQIPKLDNLNITLNLDADNIDKHSPLTIILDGESITLDHEDIKDLFYREKERKFTKLIDFMRDNDFKEKDISGVISNLRSDTNES